MQMVSSLSLKILTLSAGISGPPSASPRPHPDRCVLTPNANEFRMLVNRAVSEIHSSLEAPLCSDDSILGPVSKGSSFLLESLSSGSVTMQLRALCAVLGGVTVLLKGESDLICGPSTSTALPFPGTSEVFDLQSANGSSPRRCGGQGDILAGCMAVAVYWASALQPSPDPSTRTVLQPLINHVPDAAVLSSTLSACLLAAAVVKRASYFAFAKKGRATTSPDVLAEIGAAFVSVVDGNGEGGMVV
jgi:NAD(P)H-hydrate repair Nnr-like enzyme with NAD(P)H-hydrate dehydratase domain